LMIN